jgi:excisionase family DNA binding protein
MSVQPIEPDTWLELSEAAEYLCVHFTTLRRWADAGQVPCIRTPGGRRRFSRAQLATFLAGLQQGQVAAYASMMGAHSQQIARLGHPGLQQEPWYNRLDDTQRAAMRSEGQRLMAVLMQYAARNNGGDTFLEEGRRLAHRYGEACQAGGLSFVETLETFIHVRRNIMDSVYRAGALAGAPDGEAWRLYERMNTFLDNMLLAMLESFEAARQEALPA